MSTCTYESVPSARLRAVFFCHVKLSKSDVQMKRGNATGYIKETKKKVTEYDGRLGTI